MLPARKNDTAGNITARGSVLTPSDGPDIVTQGTLSPSTHPQPIEFNDFDQQKFSGTAETPNQTQINNRKIVIAPAISNTIATKTVGDENAPFDLWGRAYQALKTRGKSLVDAFERSITNIAIPTEDAEQNSFDQKTIQMIFRQN